MLDQVMLHCSVPENNISCPIIYVVICVGLSSDPKEESQITVLKELKKQRAGKRYANMRADQKSELL